MGPFRQNFKTACLLIVFESVNKVTNQAAPDTSFGPLLKFNSDKFN